MEKFLRRNAQNAFDAQQIKPLINEDTKLIEDDLPTVTTFLDVNFWVVQSEDVKQQDSKVLSTPFNPSEPIQLRSSIFTTHQNNNYNFDSPLFNLQGILRRCWENGIAQLLRRRNRVKAIRGPTIQQIGFDHANMLADHLRVTLQVQASEILAMV